MKLVTLIFLVSISFQTSFAQNNLKDFDSLLSKALQRHIGFPECNECDSSGLALLKISSIKDSLIINSLYASDYHFDQEKDKGFIRRFTKAYKSKFPKKSIVVIPLYFNYYKEGDILKPVNAECQKALNAKIKKLKKGTHLLNPVLISGYEPVR